MPSGGLLDELSGLPADRPGDAVAVRVRRPLPRFAPTLGVVSSQRQHTLTLGPAGEAGLGMRLSDVRLSPL